MAKQATKPQTKYADRMILPSSSQNTRRYGSEYAGVGKSMKSLISSSFLFFLIGRHL